MELDGNSFDLQTLERVRAFEPITWSESARKRTREARSFLEASAKEDKAIYGVNTGFGVFAETRIHERDIDVLQINILRSHACGVGESLNAQQVALSLVLRANSLMRGNSGVREAVIDKLLELYNKKCLPAIPSQGSVGACGDLAPLAHLALVLIGEGEVLSHDEKREYVSATEALGRCGVSPLTLKAKEGLSLINGCQISLSIGLLALHDLYMLIKWADILGALTLEALRGSRTPFKEIISASRPHPGEIATAANLRRILKEDSEIALSHLSCSRVQDPYSLRCMPAVHGAVKDQWNRTMQSLLIEANSSTDNPLLFAGEKAFYSCGNFHGMPIALPMDAMTAGAATLANIAHSRIDKLIRPNTSGLPMHLIEEGGLNSGMMMLQVTAASLISENKHLTLPASCDSVSTNVDKEDHVSMATLAARKLSKCVQHLHQVLAIELLCAQQAIYLLKGLKPSEPLKWLLDEIDLDPLTQDRLLIKDLSICKERINHERLDRFERHFGKLDI